MSIKRNIADIKRFRKIMKVLFEEGFHILIENLKLGRFVPIKNKITKNKRKSQIKPEVRLRKTLERLGPTFIKLGQILSVRSDLVPKNYIKELEKLQDSVEQFSYSEAKKIVERSLGRKIQDSFSSFGKRPVASASIAQVHKAKLKTGEQVAVKVRRPEIVELMKEDIEIMRFIADLLEKHNKNIRKYKPKAIVEEFASWAKKELDFNIEAENILRFYENFKGSKTTKIPKVFDEYSNEEVIVMEFLDGVELHKLEENQIDGIDVKKALQNGFYSILEQVFIYGFFHADPHTSNIFVLKENKIGWVDFGIVGYFDDNLKDNAGEIFIAITEGDTDKVIELMLEIGESKEDIDMIGLRKKVNEAILPLRRRKIKDIKISKVLEEVMDIALEYRIRIPREFVLFGKTIVTLEGIGLIYYPDFRFHEMAKPFLEDLIAKKYTPANMIKETLKNLFGMKKTIENLPSQTSKVLDKLDKGNIKIEMEDTDIKRLSLELDRSSNRLTYGMIMAALLISGSLTMSIGEKVVYGIPMISFLCFSGAGVIGIALIVSILRERRLKE